MNNSHSKVRIAYQSLSDSEQSLLTSRLNDKLSFDQIADWLTMEERALWTPNYHPLWGLLSDTVPPVVKPEEAERQYSLVVAKLRSQGITEEDLLEMFREKQD